VAHQAAMAAAMAPGGVTDKPGLGAAIVYEMTMTCRYLMALFVGFCIGLDLMIDEDAQLMENNVTKKKKKECKKEPP